MQLALLKYLYCIGKLEKEVKETDLICDKKMRVLRTDAAIYADVDVGIHIAKAKRLIGMYMDATEVDDKELQAMVITIIDKRNCLRHLSIGGTVVRESKAAATGVAAAVGTYEAMRQRQIRIRTVYVEACKSVKFKGMEEGDWDAEFYEDEDGETVARVDQIGEPGEMVISRVEIMGQDHCNGAKAEGRGTMAAATTDELMVRLHGRGAWAALTATEKADLKNRFMVGCHHHLDCICSARGQKAISIIKLVLLEPGIKEAGENGIYISGQGEVSANIRTQLKGFGATTGRDAFSLGDEVRARTAGDKAFEGVPYKERPWANESGQSAGWQRRAFVREYDAPLHAQELLW